MPALLRKISGKECIKILCNKFGFVAKRQRGSHVFLLRETLERRDATVVPLHRELKLGTLKGILELAHVKEEEFASYQ
ncbi:MAG: type II toxin-antitoxin system HicA family toxin [Candidatus Micrarchaeota archaeon]